MTALRHAAALPLVLAAMLACWGGYKLWLLSKALGNGATRVMGPGR